MDNFKLYAEYYNLLYKNKDYKAEADYVEKLFLELNPDSKSILDLGCGSGKHAFEFYKKGYSVTGVDLSDMMLKLTGELPPNDIEFLKGDVRNVNLNRKFDVVVSLLHVLSYQQTNEDIKAFFSAATKHLKPGGVLIFDFWYGPGVLNDKPVVRKRDLENDKVKITRIAEPEIHYDQNIVDVNYTMLINDKIGKHFSEIKETHKMRFLFSPELDLFSSLTGLKIKGKYEWMKSGDLSGTPWNAVFVLLNEN